MNIIVKVKGSIVFYKKKRYELLDLAEHFSKVVKVAKASDYPFKGHISHLSFDKTREVVGIPCSSYQCGQYIIILCNNGLKEVFGSIPEKIYYC